MSDKKREITDWEKAECLALKAAVDDFNSGKSRKDSLTQGKIADKLEISQGSVSSYLNGYNALNARVASVIAGMIGIPVEDFSPRLASEIAEMALAVQPARRELHDWEKAECAALKAEIAAHNSRGGGQKLTQEYLAQELGMTQGNLSSHLNGKRAVTKEMAAKLAVLLGIPVERFSARLASEIAEMAQAVQPASDQSTISEQDEAQALLEAVAALHVIQAGLLAGLVNQSQIQRLMQIRNEIAHQKTKPSAHCHRLQGLLAAAFSADENGGSPDDLLKMYQLGMEKVFAKEGAQTHEPGKKPARRS